MEKAFVYPILESRITWLIARIMITFMFWINGLRFLVDFSGAKTTMAANGFSDPAAIAGLTIVVALLGSLIVIQGRYAWFGAGMLGVFTLLTIIMVHDFWNMTGSAAIQAQLESEAHLSMIGGLIIVSALSHITGKYSNQIR